jgi:hypothetical protein
MNVRAQSGSFTFRGFGAFFGLDGGAVAKPGRRFGRRVWRRGIGLNASRRLSTSARRNSGLASRAPIDDRAGLDVAPPTKNAYLYPTGAVRKPGPDRV